MKINRLLSFSVLFLLLPLTAFSAGVPKGDIIDLRSGKTITAAQLLALIPDYRYLLVGEHHDNPHHHAIERWLLAQLADQQQLAGLAMEMIVPAQQQSIDQARGPHYQPEQLANTLQWSDRSSWDWQVYGPFITDAMNTRLPLAAANLDRDEISALYQQKQQHPIASKLLRDSAIEQEIIKQLEESHCHELSTEHRDGMLMIQQARDYRMAQALQNLKANKHTVLLIAGSFHVRKDIGAPRYLADQQTALAIGLVESQ